MQQDGIQGIEIDVAKISTQRPRLLKDTVSDAEDCHSKNITPVIYTSRTELQFEDQESRLAFGKQVSAFLMDIVGNLPETTGFLISKGGITSNDVLSDGLALRTSRAVGQILAECSVVVARKTIRASRTCRSLFSLVMSGCTGTGNSVSTNEADELTLIPAAVLDMTA